MAALPASSSAFRTRPCGGRCGACTPALVLPAAGRAFGAEWYEVGRFLGPSIEELYAKLPLERQVELWRVGRDLAASGCGG